MALSTILEPSTVLGKRKGHELVLHLASSPEPTDTDTNYHQPKHIIVNGQLVEHRAKRYKCTFSGCNRAYTKPSRLEEHERTHTGVRPFVCGTCHKSYLREAHLQAHTRSHLPESERPLSCDRPGCEKRFWTNQHMKVHQTWHDQAKVFACTEAGCSCTFSKHKQLRAHMCLEHGPPGTKPFQCTFDGCSKSFATNQHLKTHGKVHDEKRYTCVHVNCIPQMDTQPIFYSTWTALQHHIRTAHPPTCPHPSCNGKTFTNQKGLRAHEKLHAEREVETVLLPEPSRKKRRGGEVGRDWICIVEGCNKDFKSSKALKTHTNVTHLGRRDHVCPQENCRQAFGYKHLLQRHQARVHTVVSSNEEDYDGGSDSDPSEEDGFDFDVDAITGNMYKQRANAKVASSAKVMRCPYREVPFKGHGPTCDYVFSRAYDLRRHLGATHKIDVEKEVVETWVKKTKNTME